MDDTRRNFLKTVAAGAAATALPTHAGQPAEKPKSANRPAQTALPRWRGFNLQYLFTTGRYGKALEDDFRWIRDLGFDFIRLPMSYRIWIEGNDVYKIKESPFENIDHIVEWGRKYGIHTSLNFHRGPGYCINRGETEPFNLWKDAEALDAFCFHWDIFAKRYRGIPSSNVSFDLINEPQSTTADYEKVVRAATRTIRSVDPNRLVIIDGLKTGNEPVPEVADLGVGQSCRGYIPAGISHYRASWVDSKSIFPDPIWPDAQGKTHRWDRRRLEEHYGKWAELAKKGIGVHCGEAGAYNRTPHKVVLAWLRDILEILTAHGIGMALWNFRGSFGIIDSGRKDVAYEDFHGHKLDRKLLDLLDEFA